MTAYKAVPQNRRGRVLVIKKRFEFRLLNLPIPSRRKLNAANYEHIGLAFSTRIISWVDRIRTCGILAPKARGLPLADDPKLTELKGVEPSVEYAHTYYFPCLGGRVYLFCTLLHK